MKVHIQGKRGVPGTASAYSAYLGFLDMGFEVGVFHDPCELKDAPREDVAVGACGVCCRLRCYRQG